MTPRRKPPAYWRELSHQLRHNQIPPYVVVYVGHEWAFRVTHVPCLCVSLGAAYGVYDWSILAGLRTHIVGRVHVDRYDATPWPTPETFPELVADIAAFAAPVFVGRNGYGDSIDEPLERADSYLFGARYVPDLDSLWTPEAEADYLEREAAYYTALAADRGVIATVDDGGRAEKSQ